MWTRHLIKENSVLSSSTHSANETRKLGVVPGMQSAEFCTLPLSFTHMVEILFENFYLDRMSSVIVEKYPERLQNIQSNCKRNPEQLEKKNPEQLHSMPKLGKILIWLCLGLMNRNFQVPLKSVEWPDVSGRTLKELNMDRALKDYVAKSLFYLFRTHRKMSHNCKYAERNSLQGET